MSQCKLSLLIERFDAAAMRHPNKLLVLTGRNGMGISHGADGKDAAQEFNALCAEAKAALLESGVELPGKDITFDVDNDFRFLKWVTDRVALGRPSHFEDLPVIRHKDTGAPHPDWKETRDNPFRACAWALKSHVAKFKAGKAYASALASDPKRQAAEGRIKLQGKAITEFFQTPEGMELEQTIAGADKEMEELTGTSDKLDQCFRLAGMVGVDPDPRTLHELHEMAQGKLLLEKRRKTARADTVAPKVEEEPRHLWKKDGQTWKIRFGDEQTAMPVQGNSGLVYLCHLLQKPNRPIEGSDLKGAPPEARKFLGRDKAVDDQAGAEVNKEIQQLKRELEDAKELNNEDEQARLLQQLGDLHKYQSKSQGLTKKARSLGANEGDTRTYRAVREAIQRAMDKLKPCMAGLFRHIEKTVVYNSPSIAYWPEQDQEIPSPVWQF